MFPFVPTCLQRLRLSPLIPLLILLLAALPCLAVPEVADTLRWELALRAAIEGRSQTSLERIYQDSRVDGAVRGRALFAVTVMGGAVEGAGRVRLLEALRDPAPELRAAAARTVGYTGQRPLEREVLRIAAEDPVPEARVQALRAVRQWTRQGHLYFLEQAIISPWPAVQIEALGNLAELNYRELPPEIIARVDELAAPGAPPLVRRGALAALGRWERLSWDLAQEVVADPAAPDALRLYALELGSQLQDTTGRETLLLELLEAGSSLPLAWAAYRGLSTDAQVTVAFDEALRRYLLRTSERNAATEAMAAHLVRTGYRVDYRAGGWEIRRR